MPRAEKRRMGFSLRWKRAADGAWFPAAEQKEENGLLPKKERIASNREIKGILNRKQFRFSSPLLNITAEENNGSVSRWVVVCSKRLGKAVVRNRIRRMVLSAVANIRHKINKNVDAVIFPKSMALKSGAYEGPILTILSNVH